MRKTGTKKQRISAAVWNGIERLEARRLMSVSGATLQGPNAAGDTWMYQTTDSVSSGVVSTLTSTVVGPVDASSSPISHPAGTQVNTTLTISETDPTTMVTTTTTTQASGFSALSSGALVQYGSTGTMNSVTGGVTSPSNSTTTTDSPPAVIFPASLTAGVTTANFTTTKSISTLFAGSSTPITETEVSVINFTLQSDSTQAVTVLGKTYNVYIITEDLTDTLTDSEGTEPAATSTAQVEVDPNVGLIQIMTTQTSGSVSGEVSTQSLVSTNVSGGGGGGNSGGGGGGGGSTGGTTTGLTPTITKDTLPASVVGGAKPHGALSVSLDNTGTAAEKGYTVNVYASTDTTLDTTADTLITSVAKPTATVNAGKTTTLSIPITEVSASLDGAYYLIVQTVDSSSNSLSATSSSTVEISPPFVSLAEIVTTTLPAELVSGTVAKGTVTVDITNNGNVPSKGITPIDVTLSATPGVLGTTIVASSKSYTINPGKSTKVVEQIKSTPALADGSYFVVAQTTDPFAGRTSVASSTSAITVAAPFITLVSALGPATKSGDTLTITNDGNVPDNISKIATSLQVSTDPGGLDTVGAAVSATVGSPHILAGKSVKIHLSQWKSIFSSLSPGTYYLVIHFNDENGNSGIAVSSTALTIT